MNDNAALSAQMADKTAEVADMVKQTQTLSEKGWELRDENQRMMEDIRNQNSRIINEIKNLTDMLVHINEAIGIIDGIADQTKLIAFNASLEASSSGEAGERFAVVAGEIRRFADNVVDSTTEIKEKIAEVETASKTLITEALAGSKSIETGYERVVEQKEVFENIVLNAKAAVDHTEQISSLSQQQELASAQISTTLKEISLGVKQFVTATQSTSSIADNLKEMSGELKDTLAEFHMNNEQNTTKGVSL
jgi:methyl-accepting chemotaxis protein